MIKGKGNPHAMLASKIKSSISKIRIAGQIVQTALLPSTGINISARHVLMPQSSMKLQKCVTSAPLGAALATKTKQMERLNAQSVTSISSWTLIGNSADLFAMAIKSSIGRLEHVGTVLHTNHSVGRLAIAHLVNMAVSIASGDLMERSLLV
jgi:hypothetical protein